MKILRTLTVIAGILAGSLGAQTALAAGPVKAKNVVLVHGAWADGSSWAQVIPKLQAAGLHVTAVQNPLTSLEIPLPRHAAFWRNRTARRCWWRIPGVAP